MKAVVASILFVFCLLALHNHAHASTHKDKLSSSAFHHSIQKQLPEAGNFIDVEDDNDDKNVTKKFTHHAKWIGAIASIVFSFDAHHSSANALFNSYLPDSTGTAICIEHRVLRI